MPPLLYYLRFADYDDYYAYDAAPLPYAAAADAAAILLAIITLIYYYFSIISPLRHYDASHYCQLLSLTHYALFDFRHAIFRCRYAFHADACASLPTAQCKIYATLPCHMLCALILFRH